MLIYCHVVCVVRFGAILRDMRLEITHCLPHVIFALNFQTGY